MAEVSWWQSALVFVITAGGFIAKDSYQHGKIKGEMTALKDRIDIIEKEKCIDPTECEKEHKQIRRDRISDLERLGRLEQKIDTNEMSSQTRHNELMLVLLKTK